MSFTTPDSIVKDALEELRGTRLLLEDDIEAAGRRVVGRVREQIEAVVAVATHEFLGELVGLQRLARRRELELRSAIQR